MAFNIVSRRFSWYMGINNLKDGAFSAAPRHFGQRS
ncbi:hypothetical protein CCP2SC5_380023 [Azospirillaceae bacterium]